MRHCIDSSTGDLSPAPTCSLKLSGTSSNGGYTGDVTVTMETTGVVLEKGLDVTANSTNGSVSTVHTDDGVNITYYGYASNDIGEGTCEVSFTKDTVAPSCPTITTNVASGTWTSENVVFTFGFDSDTDNWDWYTNDDNDEWKFWTNNASSVTTKTISGAGTRRVKVIVYDKYGNSRECTNGDQYYYIDKTTPTCELAYSGTAGSNGWYKSGGNLTMTITSSSLSGDDTYGLVEGTTATYNSVTSIAVSSSTTSTTYTGAVKNGAGTVGTNTFTLKMDNAAPTISSLTATLDSSNKRYLTATIADSVSKVDSYAVTTSSTTPTSFTDITDTASYSLKYNIPLSAGTYYVWAKDVTGNVSTAATITVPNIYFTISYSLDGGTAGSSAPTSGVGGTTVTVSNPTKAGWTFKGWTVSGTGASISGTTLTVGTSNITLTANWETNLATYITYMYNNAASTNSLAADDPAGNIRYVGSSPRNYVTFNGETWRIIGTFTVSGAKRVKLVRNDVLATSASWDSSSSSVNSGQGVNEWSQADIMYMLNQYYAGSSSTCRYCQASGVSTWTSCGVNCASTISKLSSTALSMISSVTWNTGTVSFIKTNLVAEIANVSAASAYNQERGSTTGKQCVSGYVDFCYDTVTRYTTWTGKVGLIYPSDYGYASTDSSCRSNMTNTTACKNNNWMHITVERWGVWTMTPAGWWNFNNAAAYIDNGGYLSFHFGNIQVGVRPVVYLNTDVAVITGNGTSGSPYIFKTS